MTATISKRTRERAAQLCSMAACTSTLLLTVCRNQGARRGGPARALAFAAVSHVVSEHGVSRDRYAEAEALLRTDWSPGGAR